LRLRVVAACSRVAICFSDFVSRLIAFGKSTGGGGIECASPPPSAAARSWLRPRVVGPAGPQAVGPLGVPAEEPGRAPVEAPPPEPGADVSIDEPAEGASARGRGEPVGVRKGSPGGRGALCGTGVSRPLLPLGPAPAPRLAGVSSSRKATADGGDAALALPFPAVRCSLAGVEAELDERSAFDAPLYARRP
jgi:hypothetical protein